MKRFTSLVLALLCPLILQAETLTGRVVKVIDGDTVTLLDASKIQHKIRLAGIDAPESKQPYGQKSKEALSALVAGQQVEVDWHKRDRYGRVVSKIIAGVRDVNLAQVRAGMAWWYRKYANEQSPVDQRLYKDAEAKAKQASVGLWSGKNPIPPWEWRKSGTGTQP